MTVRTEPFTGFGDDPNWSVKFCVQGRAGADRDWVSGARVAELVPATGHGIIRQRMGRDPYELKLELLFDDSDAMEALDAYVGKSATLRIPWGHTKRVGGTLEVIQDQQYLKLPDTYLASLDEHTDYISYPGGIRRGTATFRRTYVDPAPFVPPVWPDPPMPDPLPTPLLFLSPGLSRNRAGAVTPTINGAVRSSTMDGAAAWATLPPVTNLCANPLFGTNTTGWTAANATLTRSTAWAYTGTTSGLLAATAANAEASYAITIPASAHYIAAYVRNATGGSRTARIKYNGALVGTAVTIPAGGEAIVSALVTGTATSVGAAVVITNSTNGDNLYVGHFQVQAQGRGLVAFCPMFASGGSLEVGDSWSGTPHASTSSL